MASLKEKTATGLLWGALNNGLMQVLNIVFGIFLARMLSPADYGLVGMLAIFTALATTLQESGFTSALVNKRDVTASDYNSVFWFSTLTGSALFLLLFLSTPLIARYFHQPELEGLARVAFVAIPLAAVGVVPQAWLFKNLKVKEATVIRISALVVSGSVGVVLAVCGLAYWSLVAQQLLYVGITSLGKYFLVPWRPSLHIDFGPVRYMFGFSCKIMLTSVITTVNQNLLTVIFGRLFPAQTVGEYTQANKWSAMASGLVSGTTSQVMQPVFASVSDDAARQVGVVRKMMRFTAFLAFPVMFGLAIVSEEFIVTAISTKWLGSVPLLQVLCVSGAFIPLQQTLQNLLISRGRSGVYLWVTVAQIVLQMAVIIALASFGIRVMVMGYAVFNILWTAVWQLFVGRVIPLRLFDTLRDTVPFMLAAAVAMGVAWLAAMWTDNMVLSMVTKMAVAALTYYMTMRLSHARIMEECIAFLLRKRNKQ